jgi:uncharacterized protein YdeI (YjbR/CyaY-like superfamily)
MSHYDKRVDAYIAKSAEFAQPLLEHLRELVHEACPDVEETIKWGFPHFQYKGILCSMASFKAHCSFGFWKGAIMDDPKGILSIIGKTSMGHFNRITAIQDLPARKILMAYVKHAMQLNEGEIKVPKKVIKSKTLVVPGDFLKRLKKKKNAFDIFEAFSNSHRNEYVQWITESKSEATRTKRIDQAVEWLNEGKSRNWKYAKK